MSRAHQLKQFIKKVFPNIDLNLDLCNPNSLFDQVKELGVADEVANDLFIEAIRRALAGEPPATLIRPITLIFQTLATTTATDKAVASIRIQYQEPPAESTYLATFSKEGLEKVEKVELSQESPRKKHTRVSDTAATETTNFVVPQPGIKRQKSIPAFFSSHPASTENNATQSTLSKPKINVLIVDDGAMELTVTKRFVLNRYKELKNANDPDLDIEIAKSGLEAVNKCNSSGKEFAFILMDYQMGLPPNLNGLEAASKIIEQKTQQSETTVPPIVLLTASLTDDVREKANILGIDSLSKPMKKEDAEGLLNKHVLKRSFVDEAEQRDYHRAL